MQGRAIHKRLRQIACEAEIIALTKNKTQWAMKPRSMATPLIENLEIPEKNQGTGVKWPFMPLRRFSELCL